MRNLVPLVIGGEDGRNDSINLVNWTLTGFNVTDVSYDSDTSHFLLIESSQRIKLFLNNVKMSFNFISSFNLDDSILDYREMSNVTISTHITSLAVLFQLKVDN